MQIQQPSLFAVRQAVYRSIEEITLKDVPTASLINTVVEQKPPLVLSAEDRASSAGVGAKGGCYVSRRERCG
jgi:hypothetical protein